MQPSVLRSYGKINLGLRIGPPRPDGFHDLVTMYQTVALYDLVSVQAAPAAATAITISCSDARVPTDRRNTAYRMAEAALAAMGRHARVHIDLDKRLPPQGGMGAGSANAAAALLGLERQLGASLPGPERLRVAESIGSDVPLFLVGGTVCGLGRGQIVLPYPDLPPMPCVIVAPRQGSSTPAAFRAWDESVAGLTAADARDRLDELCRVYASAFDQAEAGAPGSLPGAVSSEETGSLGVSGALAEPEAHADGDLAGNPLPALVRTGIENDFEQVVFQQDPSLREIKNTLLGTGPEQAATRLAMLSGSGSSMFGLYGSRTEAEQAMSRVESLGLGARVMFTQTLGRRQYWRSMVEP